MMVQSHNRHHTEHCVGPACDGHPPGHSGKCVPQGPHCAAAVLMCSSQLISYTSTGRGASCQVWPTRSAKSHSSTVTTPVPSFTMQRRFCLRAHVAPGNPTFVQVGRWCMACMCWLASRCCAMLCDAAPTFVALHTRYLSK
jgi:hypothetical protein